MATHLGLKKSKKITQKQLTVFTRQWATLLAAGIPLTQTLSIIIRNQTNPAVVKLITKLKIEIEAGNTVAQALRRYPHHFSILYCSLIEVGEQSGLLDVMLTKIAAYREKMEVIRSKIRKAMFYPVMVILIAVIVTAGLLLFVVPQFETLFHSFGAKLPAMTQLVIDSSQFIQQFWGLIILFFMVATIGIVYGIKHSLQFAQRIDQVSLKMPVLGAILQKAAISRFAQTLSITFAAGLPLVDALKVVAGTTGNSIFATAILSVRKEVATGQSMYSAIKKTQIFPEMVLQMINVGEESGSLELMLNKIAELYEQEVNASVDSLSTLLEPFIMVVLGILVGGLVMSMYLPIFQLGSVA